MGIRNLQKMFSPSSICVIGASKNKNDDAHLVIQNLTQGGFNGPVMPISTDQTAIGGILTYKDVASLPLLPDLAIICCEARSPKEDLENLAQNGVKSAILIGKAETALEAEYTNELTRTYGIRILGPDSMGAIIPSKNLNASTLHLPVQPGKIAFVSQSDSMSSTVLDWANAHGVGFSHFISLGNSSGIDYGDIIDYLGSDPFTRAILLYMESIHERRNFMSAARAAARNKPILVMKTGKHEAVSLMTQSHTGAMAGSDLVYDAAFKRAGMLRVNSIAELFAAAETLSVTKPFKGKRLAVISNGGGLNIISSDHLLDNGGELAEFSDETKEKIQNLLKKSPSISNPVDLGANADGNIYAQAYEIVKTSKEADCILFLHAPNKHCDSTQCAQKLAEAHKKLKGHILTCWVGEESIKQARKVFEENQIPTYTSPRMAITAFMHIVQYLENQEMLMETPQRVPADIKPARLKVRKIIDEALSRGENWLKETDTKQILKAYGIDTVESHFVTSMEEARKTACEIGFPVVVKIISQDVVHKSDVGGVVLSLTTEQSVEDAICGIKERVTAYNPDAVIDGYIVQKMVSMPMAHELIAGMTHDPVFGPVMLFGEGGTATELIGDRAIALPPLNMGLAKDVISRTNISRLLDGYRDHPEVDKNALCQLLIELSEICIDFPEILEMDINPIFSSKDGALAVDSRMRIQECTKKFPNRRLAIRPYPAELEESFTLRNGRETLIRPIRPEDEPAHNEFMTKISPEDIRFRFFGSVRKLPHSEMARLTQIDYDREMAFIAQAPHEEDGHMETLGVVRTGTDPNNDEAEYAILVRSDLKGQKLGWKLLNKMIEYCRSRGTAYFTGQILRENRPMLDMVKAMGFEAHTIMEEDIVEVRLKLQK
ncbi:bifunctional acetate--CoA ligase family protein/GNAT family N-acetyltransferase [Terasakiella sp. SH-1]|uniref:bifunctional acetate--CoA ligase family protein/GNAT family N-acetyltransferase n=1 Tax=Terasakiella sp. SH-1 TaxID=2560057 RepID=UPI001073F752|nr:bifunctional acetate--CoA ligase family protein/GNAT family N-acetyltransferase [Terasakiella sp. SH-1]